MTAALRVVLDTNVVLSALVFATGRLTSLREAWQQERCQPLVSSATAAELIQVLRYPKFKLTGDEQQQLLADYLPYCVAVRMPSKLPRIPACRDPFDVPFLQLAIIGKAEHLVTGDKDLLGLAGKIACSIITPQQLLAALAGTHP